MKLFALETGALKLDGGAMFGVIPRVMWEKSYPPVEQNYTKWAMRCLLIIDGNKKILIDTGLGNKQDKAFISRFIYPDNNTLENSLEACGFTPNDITDVIHTHLHFDHCGGSVIYNSEGELVPAFPNARYYVSKTHWDLYKKPNYFEKASFLDENIQPLYNHNVLHFIDSETQFSENVYLQIFNGHTKGQIIPVIKYGNSQLVYGADVFPSAAHVPLAWIMAYDTEPLITLEEKQKFYKQATENNTVLFFEHDWYHQCASLQSTQNGMKIKETFTLSQFLEYYK